MGMIDAQMRDHELKTCKKERAEIFEELQQWKESYRSLWKKHRMTEKLIELNMKDLWEIADQRDWYYEEYRKLKEK
jgi:phosphosulfolactate phosphohydrolase-like enzyme